ncbi:MAG TPA: CPBP family intramembrane glutamic endopeptidase [Terracidiphilus sp.]|nr:CPBP family intramembrane glutamic endopeptidase [Terracidiphilus sp.]
MTNLPEDPLREPFVPPGSESSGPSDFAEQQAAAPSPFGENSQAFEPPAPSFSYPPSTSPDRPLFYSYSQPVRRSVRIPNFGHLLLLSLLILVAFSILVIALALASHFHFLGFKLSQKSATDLGFNLMSEAVLYLITFGFSLFVFPMVWNESLFAGLEWCGTEALSKFGPLAATALGCFGLAAVDQILMPGPANAPIEKMLSSPGAAWMMFAFGVTMAPFFEEMFFRGFLLPSLCTTCDWIAEKMRHTLPRPLDANGHPQWSLTAMIIGSVLTSIPFAGLHVEQQGHSLGPFLLLIAISLILCTVRLKFRSLAASTLVHASYNFFIFSLTLAVTGGFRHFDKM